MIDPVVLNDKSGLSETSVATWTNIVLLRFQSRMTWNRCHIQLSSSLSLSRWCFLLLRRCSSLCRAFFDNKGNNATLFFLHGLCFWLILGGQIKAPHEEDEVEEEEEEAKKLHLDWLKNELTWMWSASCHSRLKSLQCNDIGYMSSSTPWT
jgi:hypothetical protein